MTANCQTIQFSLFGPDPTNTQSYLVYLNFNPNSKLGNDSLDKYKTGGLSLKTTNDTGNKYINTIPRFPDSVITFNYCVNNTFTRQTVFNARCKNFYQPVLSVDTINYTYYLRYIFLGKITNRNGVFYTIDSVTLRNKLNTNQEYYYNFLSNAFRGTQGLSGFNSNKWLISGNTYNDSIKVKIWRTAVTKLNSPIIGNECQFEQYNDLLRFSVPNDISIHTIDGKTIYQGFTDSYTFSNIGIYILTIGSSRKRILVK
jgi:hypothetical protein